MVEMERVLFIENASFLFKKKETTCISKPILNILTTLIKELEK